MNDVMPSSCTKAYVELMGIDKCMKEHTYNTYIVKSNLGSKESWIIQLNQDVHVCGVMKIYGGYPNSIMLLENITLIWT
jgi:hypothetical protein